MVFVKFIYKSNYNKRVKHLKLFESFDFGGEYDRIEPGKYRDILSQALGDSRYKLISENFHKSIVRKFIENGFDVFVDFINKEQPDNDEGFGRPKGSLIIKARKTIENGFSDEALKFLKNAYSFSKTIIIVLTISELKDEFFLVEWRSGVPNEVNRLFFECDQFEALSKLLDDKLSYFR